VLLHDVRDGGPIVRLCDFGSSKLDALNTMCRSYTGTYEYMAPEILFESQVLGLTASLHVALRPVRRLQLQQMCGRARVMVWLHMCSHAPCVKLRPVHNRRHAKHSDAHRRCVAVRGAVRKLSTTLCLTVL
jgi:serine/threonine protein kinase